MSKRAELYRVVRDMKSYLRWQQASGAAGSVPAPAAEREAFEARQKAREQAKLDRLTKQLQGGGASSARPESSAPSAGAASNAPSAGTASNAPSANEQPSNTPSFNPFGSKEQKKTPEAPKSEGGSTPWKSGIGSRPKKRFGGRQQKSEAAKEQKAQKAKEQTSGPAKEHKSKKAKEQKRTKAQQQPSNEPPPMDYGSFYADEADMMPPADYDPSGMTMSAARPSEQPQKSASSKKPKKKEMTKAEKLEFLEKYLGDCQRCGLCEHRTNIAFGVGDPEAKLVFVGEAPGYNEDQQGEPFVGKAGQLLDKMIEAMGLTREQVYICNVIKCRPPDNRNPHPEEIKECSPFLRKQLQAIEPQVIVTLGKFASQFVTGEQELMGRLRGQWHQWEGVPVMPTYHPAYLLRSPRQKKNTWNDLQMVMERLGLEDQ